MILPRFAVHSYHVVQTILDVEKKQVEFVEALAKLLETMTYFPGEALNRLHR